MKEDRTVPLAQMEDSGLVELAQKGERAAFESLFHRYQDKIYTLALGITGNTSDAKDVVQETFVRAYSRLSHLKRDGGVLGYLRKTASNAAVDILRARRSGKQLSMEALAGVGSDIADSRRGPDELAEQTNSNVSLMTAILSLPEDQRLVIVLHHLEDLRVDEIATRLSIPIGTVKSRLGRGREALRRKLIGRIGQ